LAEGFQRRRLKCEKLTDDEPKVMAKAHIAFVKVSEKIVSNLRSSHMYYNNLLRSYLLLGNSPNDAPSLAVSIIVRTMEE
jgi:hypothetical protein